MRCLGGMLTFHAYVGRRCLESPRKEPSLCFLYSTPLWFFLASSAQQEHRGRVPLELAASCDPQPKHNCPFSVIFIDLYKKMEGSSHSLESRSTF
jgi:hypothetical protein